MLRNLNRIRTLSIIIALTGFVFVSSVSALAPVSDKLGQVLSDSKTTLNDSLVTVVVFLDKADGSINKLALPQMNRQNRIKTTLSSLRNSRGVNNFEIETFLNARSINDPVKHWIVPAYTVRLSLKNIEQLRLLPGVRRVVENVALSYEPPVAGSPAPSKSAAVSSHLEMLQVPQLWQRGVTGRGRLVCSFDTGVESSHPALSSRWRGQTASLSASWFSPIKPNSNPSDLIGHGTHTMGIMVGATATDTIGVAPEAEWITAGVIDQGHDLAVTLNDILNAFEWVLNPDGDSLTTDDVPDVILNSWGIPKGLFSPCDDIFVDVIDAVESAGIVTIFAVGNEGPNPMTVRSPADIASTPINTFSVGAVDNSKVVASFSSRGPSSCDQSSIKPEVVAPGVSVRSSWKGGGYFYMTGTSMAAPFIAGLVALMRQYNPDVTVEAIKNALINSADDLGSTGEDNSYGYGLPNASLLLDLISAPTNPEIVINSPSILNAPAFPGESFQLRISLTNAAANVEEVIGTIITPENNGVEIAFAQTSFIFGGGVNAVNLMPYELTFSNDLYNGLEVPFELVLDYTDGTNLDTLEFALMVGLAPLGVTADHHTSMVDFTISDFGQFGLAPSSFYDLNQLGLRYNGSDNLLYEAGVVVGRNNLQLASSIRDSLGEFAVSDFIPTNDGSLVELASSSAQKITCEMKDSRSDVPIPIKIKQETTTFDAIGEDEIVLLRYTLINSSLSGLSGLRFGFMVDLDLPGGSERVEYDPFIQMAWQRSDNGGPLVGIVALERITAFTSFSNGVNKTGMTNVQLFEAISVDSSAVSSDQAGDYYTIANAGPFSLAPNQKVEVALALVFGDDLTALYENAVRAKEKYDFSTDVDENENNLPDGFVLNQNYPNPFNPSTTISFSLPNADDVTLDIFNMLGQHVNTLFSGKLSAGSHSYSWKGISSQGEPVSSGVYFYRVTTTQGSLSRKMALLK